MYNIAYFIKILHGARTAVFLIFSRRIFEIGKLELMLGWVFAFSTKIDCYAMNGNRLKCI